MEKILSSAGESLEYSRLYLEQQVTHLQLEAVKRLAKTTSGLITAAVISFCGFMVVLFLSLALAFFMASLWGSYTTAFLLLTLLYSIVAAVLFYFREQLITRPIIDLILKSMFD